MSTPIRRLLCSVVHFLEELVMLIGDGQIDADLQWDVRR